MRQTDPVAGEPAAAAKAAARRFAAPRRFAVASPTTALVLGVVVLALMIVDAPLAGLAHQSMAASGGSLPIWDSAAFGVVGFVVAWRQPRNPLGWIILGIAFFFTLSEDASFYAVADYGLRHGRLPLGWVAMLAQPGWAPAIALIGVTFLLFPDGRLPLPRWRWVLWVFLAVAVLWMAGALEATVGAIIGHRIRVDSGGNLLLLSGTNHSAGWWNLVQSLFFLLLGVAWLVSLGGQVASYRRSSWERRQQLKWLMGGGVICVAGGLLSTSLSSGIVQHVASAGFLALPVSMGVAILRYRLYDIDRIISRTLAYAIVTGLRVAVYAGLVLLAIQVLRLASPVAVAASTLAAAALFNPLRRRVQRLVDRRFNRARYDADQTVAAFAARLKDAVDLDSVRADLAGVVQAALEPVHASVWISQDEYDRPGHP
jgi:hypothetical protein